MDIQVVSTIELLEALLLWESGYLPLCIFCKFLVYPLDGSCWGARMHNSVLQSWFYHSEI